LSTFHFDFGGSKSPVANGYVGVPLISYTQAQGYGWASIAGMTWVDQGGTNALTEDFHSGQDCTFLVDLPNGYYDVTPTLGDATTSHTVAIWAEGQPLTASLTTRPQEYVHPTFRVQVIGGQLSFRIAATGGSSSFAINGLDIDYGNGMFEHMTSAQVAQRPDAHLTDPRIAGVQFLIPWAQLEPSKGTFDFSTLDQMLSLWGGAGKKVMFDVKTAPAGAESGQYASSATPQWVYAEGVPYVISTSTGVTQQIPVYWDPVFLQEYQKLVEALAAHCDGNPGIEFIMVGPGVFHSTRAIYPADMGAFQQVGYTAALWYQTNVRIMGMYQQAFHFSHLGLDMAPLDSANNPDPQYNQFSLAQLADREGMTVYYHNLYGNSTWTNSPYPQFFASLGTSTKIGLGMDTTTSGSTSLQQTYGDPVSCVEYAFGGVNGLASNNTYYMEWYLDDVDAATQGSTTYDPNYDAALTLAWQDFQALDTVGQPINQEINPAGPDWAPAMSASVNGVFFYAGPTSSQGNELWKNDGTVAGNVTVQNQNSANLAWVPENLTAVNAILFFTATDGTHGTELWKTDGTSAGTMMVADLNPGAASSNPAWLTNVNGTLFFVADDGTNGPQIWKSDGTAAGTVLVSKFNTPYANKYPWDLTAVGSTLYFVADDGTHGPQLWKTDGTTAGTVLVKVITPAGGDGPSELTAVQGKLYFAAEDGQHGRELWKSTGTATGTVLVKDINSGAADANPTSFISVNGTLFLRAYDGTNSGLWRSDGTTAGTSLVLGTAGGGAPLDPFGLTVVGSILYFAAGSPTPGYNLWKSDGTTAGTVSVFGSNPGGQAVAPYGFTAVNGIAYFAATDPVNGIELWKSDGTAAGTTLVWDINPGGGSSGPDLLANVQGTVFFWGNDGVHGVQLLKWNTNPATQFLVSGPGTSTAGTSFPVWITILDQYGHTGPAYLGTIHFTSSDHQATLPADYTFTAADGGTHKFWPLQLDTAGTQSMTVKDTKNGSVAGSASVSVSPAALHNLLLLGPATSTAGVAFTLTVEAVDAFGNVVPTYTGTVHFQTSDSRATLPADYTFLAGDTGVHTFVNGVTLVRAGKTGLSAVDTMNSTVKGTFSVTVSPGTAASLALSFSNTNPTAGVAFSVTLTVLDAYGNTATAYTGTVRFTATDGQAVLPASYTFTSADQGVHVFNGVVLKTAGQQTITATDTVKGTITGQKGCRVTAAAATHFGVTASTSTPYVGSPFTVTVLALDPYGNTDTHYAGTVHFTSTDSRATLPANYTFVATDNGRHVFTKGVTLNTAGTQTITVTDTAHATIKGSVTVTAQSHAGAQRNAAAVSPAAPEPNRTAQGPDLATLLLSVESSDTEDLLLADGVNKRRRLKS
jgi:ELWxxDGT repeat protein